MTEITENFLDDVATWNNNGEHSLDIYMWLVVRVRFLGSLNVKPGLALLRKRVVAWAYGGAYIF